MNNYGALKSLPAQTTIKGQPHQLSYITPQEAGVLKMLGGAGKNVNGVPAYYKAVVAVVATIVINLKQMRHISIAWVMTSKWHYFLKTTE